MPLFYLFLLLQFTTLFVAQKNSKDAEQNVRRLVLAVYEREEQARNSIAAVREQIRQSLSSKESHLEFDAYFSNLASKDFKKAPSVTLNAAITKVISIDSLTRLIALWGNYKLQTLPLSNYQLTKENATATVLPEMPMLWQYLPFFNIQNGDKIGELGAGSGWLSLILAILYDRSSIYINELGPFATQEIRKKMAPHFTSEQQTRFHFVNGTKTATHLESEELDVIIAVDAFHHFREKISMLQSIKWSLAKGGRLCVVEQVKTYDKSSEYCPEALEKWELEQVLQENGFVKTRERLMTGRKDRNIYLLEYRVESL